MGQGKYLPYFQQLACMSNFFACIHNQFCDYVPVLNGIKTKLDNANRVPCPPSGYTGSKAFLKKIGQVALGRFFCQKL